MAGVACYKMHTHLQQKQFWILPINIVCIFGEQHESFSQTLVGGQQRATPEKRQYQLTKEKK